MSRGRDRTASLDGIRAFAVLAVLAYHFGVPGVAGGSLGVDVFFVLSGYLITSLMVREHHSSGTIRLRAFWGRRARRLFPALFVLVMGVLAYAHFFASDVNFSSLRSDVASTLLYFANWHFVLSAQGYFAKAAAPSPLLHTWTLGVEEQYYVIWPLVGFLVLRRFSRRALAWVAGAGAVVSAVAMGAMYASGVSLDRLYYGTDTRAQALLVGSCLAAIGSATEWRIIPDHWARTRSRRSVILLAGTAGAGFIVWACHSLTGEQPFLYRGGFFLVAISVAAVIVMLVTLPRSLASWLLSLGPVAYVGRISYGVYLYHWPVLLVMDHAHTGLSGFPLLVSRVAVTFAAAIISFELLERPIRERRLFRGWRGPLSVAVAGSAVAGSVAAVTLSVAPSAAVAATTPTQSGTAPPAYTLAHPVVDLMIGDSIALSLDEGLKAYSLNWGVEFVTGNGPTAGIQLGCDLDPGSTVMLAGLVSRATENCGNWRQNFAALVSTYDPDVVTVLLGRWEISDRIFDGHWTHIGEPGWDSHLSAELEQLVTVLSARGAKVVLLTMPYVDPVGGEAPNGSVYSENIPSRVDAYNSLLRQVAARRPGVASVFDLNRMLDPWGRYTPTVHGVPVRWSDGIHVTIDGGLLLYPKIMPELVSLGLAHDELRNTASRTNARTTRG